MEKQTDNDNLILPNINFKLSKIYPNSKGKYPRVSLYSD